MVIDLANGGRVVVQLAPAFAPVHVANIKALARGGYWDGASVYRVQDNYVAQWGHNESDQAMARRSQRRSRRPNIRGRSRACRSRRSATPDPYAPGAGFADGWPIAYSAKAGWADLTHCYGSVGVGRDLSPDTGHRRRALRGDRPCDPRQLDRNIALVGRVVDGHRPPQLAPARHRGARLLQGQGAICADRERPAGERHARVASGRPMK